MAVTNFSNGISSFGMPVFGGGGLIPPSTGKVFWVHSGSGANAVGRGLEPQAPFRTIAYAVTRCTANKNDTILVMPGHSEVVNGASAFLIQVAGVSIIGLGNQSNRPTVTFTTSTAATINVSAANVRIRNIIIDGASGALDAVAALFTVSGANFTFEDSDIIMADGTAQATCALTTAAGASGLRFLRNEVVAPNAGAAQVILFGAVIDNVEIDGNLLNGNFSTAAIANASTNHATNLFIRGNTIWQKNGTAKAVLNLTSASTGMVAYNTFLGTTWATAADAIGTGTGMKYFQNFGFDDASGAVSGVLTPAVGTLA
jgi:hypothetical protein